MTDNMIKEEEREDSLKKGSEVGGDTFMLLEIETNPIWMKFKKKIKIMTSKKEKKQTSTRINADIFTR